MFSIELSCIRFNRQKIEDFTTHIAKGVNFLLYIREIFT